MSVTRIGNLSLEPAAEWASQQAQKLNQPLICLLPDMQSARKFLNNLEFFANPEIPIIEFPDWEILPYDRFSPHEDIISERLRVLNLIPKLNKGIIVLTIQTALLKIPPKSHVLDQSFDFKIGEKFNLLDNKKKLERAGYNQVSQIQAKGEYAQRGAILDIFPMGSLAPYRIDLFDDEIESIRTFDLETQRSLKPVSFIKLLPTREYPQDPQTHLFFCENLIKNFGERVRQSTIYQALSKHQTIAGLESYLPLFFKSTGSFFDYCDPLSPLIFIDLDKAQIETQAHAYFQTIKNRFELVSHDIDRPALSPEHLYFQPDLWFGSLKNFEQIKLSQSLINQKNSQKQNSNITYLPPLFIQTQHLQPWAQLSNFLQDSEKKNPDYLIILTAESEGRREVLLTHFKRINLYPEIINNFQSIYFLNQNSNKNSNKNSIQKIFLTISPLDHGYINHDAHFILITEGDLFPNIASLRQTREERKNRTTQEAQTEQAAVGIYDLSELSPGMPVVHITHGVGKYIGLQTLNINNQDQDLITLEYAGNNKLYVPIHQMRLISRYSSGDRENPTLSHLGTPAWNKALEKAQKKIYDTAAELLAIYARRSQLPGLVYHLDEDAYLKFSADFPFEETPDQKLAIQAIIKDMQSKNPMDRLLCGDVGFGKTEVAMRASFIAVQNHKQVAILVPTTLLANQHFQTFSDRFANWPVHIQLLSRFRTEKENLSAIKQLKSGQVDIVIGTHKLLSQLVDFKDLGLVIIDEEHRFGVRDKEKLKSLRAEVDILAMTATPIPRTLNLSLSRVRDLSIIATPPKKRLSIKTFVLEKNNGLLKEALLRETMRGGQVYFLHNDVKTMELTKQELEKLLPDLSFGIAHGQMAERELERIMTDFYHARFQVLICSTIIETGIDIPNANTIIIDRADHLGLAQLHQLRGRVGRSHHQAYAYLLTPPWDGLTPDAKKRLEAIIETKELGSGLSLASHDLEIRGAGEILGEDQSGHIHHIGFSLYMELLDHAVKSLEQGESPNILNFENLRKAIEIDLGESAIIPETYLPDVSLRLNFYRKLSQVKNNAEIEDIQVELIDRFGLLPDPVKLLGEQTRLRLEAEKLGITKIKAGKTSAKVEFADKPLIDPIKIIKLLQTESNLYKMAGPNNLQVIYSDKNNTDKNNTDKNKSEGAKAAVLALDQLLNKLKK